MDGGKPSRATSQRLNLKIFSSWTDKRSIATFILQRYSMINEGPDTVQEDSWYNGEHEGGAEGNSDNASSLVIRLWRAK